MTRHLFVQPQSGTRYQPMCHYAWHPIGSAHAVGPIHSWGKGKLCRICERHATDIQNAIEAHLGATTWGL